MPLPSVTVHHKVAFAETDAAGLVHFSNYFRYMENAEQAFFEQAGLPLFDRDERRVRGFPRVDAQCRFAKPLYFGDTVAITLTLRGVRSCALQFDFRFDKGAQLIAEGSLTTVFSEFEHAEGKMAARLLPPDWLERMGWHTDAAGRTEGE